MKHVDLSELTSKRFAVIGDLDAMHAYYWFELYEEETRSQARRVQAARIDLWQKTLCLHREPFAPGHAIELGGDQETLAGQQQYFSGRYRTFLLATVAGTCKLALDAALDGYYTQCFTLCRTLFETFKRVTYVRRQPAEVFRWIPEDWITARTRSLPGFFRPPGNPSKEEWASAFEGNSPQDEIDRMLNGAANRHLKYLHSHAHPTLEGATQLMMDSEFEAILHPFLSEPHLSRCLHVGIAAEQLLLMEIGHLKQMPDEWLKACADLRRTYRELFADYGEAA